MNRSITRLTSVVFTTGPRVQDGELIIAEIVVLR
jgi:hypothetical protein